MKQFKSPIYGLLVLALCVPNAGAFFFDLSIFESIINVIFSALGVFGLWDMLAKSLCDTFENLLPDTLNNCRCTGSYKINTGLGGEFFCAIGGENTCLIDGDKKNDPDLFCGVATVETEFDGSGIGPSEVCFEVVSNLPSNVPMGGNIPLFLCIELTPLNAPTSFLEFSRCAITFNDRRCGRCTVCDGNRDFSFDCSNVNVNPNGDFVAGPDITTCIGFGTLFGFLGGIVGA